MTHRGLGPVPTTTRRGADGASTPSEWRRSERSIESLLGAPDSTPQGGRRGRARTVRRRQRVAGARQRHDEPQTVPTPSKGRRSDRWAYNALAIIAIGFLLLKAAT